MLDAQPPMGLAEPPVAPGLIEARNHKPGCIGTRTPDLPVLRHFRAGWIVAVTHPHAELWAQTNLRTRGYTTFLPLHLVRRRDRVTPTITRTMLAPLWPGYCFVAYDSRDPRRPIRETPGVRDVIRCGSQVQWCPNGAVEALQATEDARRSLPPPGARWAPGTPCSLAHGPMRGLPAVVTHTNGDTATIACLFLGQLREITVPVDALTHRDNV